ncbi:MAG: DNA polymerase IV [Clostridia bacterium]|nr:DNA polymerase IV [Clostridia bacterium]
MERKIIHLDMDAFFAAIEERDNPDLKGKPVIVGAPPNVRGVVSTCNYEARKYGVHSAMSSQEAYRRCPGGIFITPHFKKYAEASEKVHACMQTYTDCIEFLSLDEGYMDVTGSERFFGSASSIAQKLQQEVFEAVGTTCSVGVGYNMLTAKLASEEKKPQGFFVIDSPETFQRIMKDRPVGVLYGIGAKTAEKLYHLGIRTVGDLAKTSLSRLTAFGISAEEMINYAKGIDHREVTPNAPAKSIGKETTFLKDVTDLSVLKDTLLLLSRTVSDLLKEKHLFCRTVTLKLKFYNMQSITRSCSGKLTNQADDLYQTAELLLMQNLPQKPVRLIGITTGNLSDCGYEQLSFTEETKLTSSEDALDAVVTQLRSSYGKGSLKTAKELLAEQHLKQLYKE